MPQKMIVFLKTCSKLNKNKLLQDRHQIYIMDEIDKLLEQLALAVTLAAIFQEYLEN